MYIDHILFLSVLTLERGHLLTTAKSYKSIMYVKPFICVKLLNKLFGSDEKVTTLQSENRQEQDVIDINISYIYI